MNLEFRKKAKIEATPTSTIPPPSRQGNKKPSGSGGGRGGHKAVNKQPKAPGGAGGQNDQAGGNKRVYSCPHCQRYVLTI